MSTLAELHIDQDRFNRLIELAREEDLGTAGDITTLACSRQQTSCNALTPLIEACEPQADSDTSSVITAELVARQPGTIAGLELVPQIMQHFDKSLLFSPSEIIDSSKVQSGAVIGKIRGAPSAILTCERTLLNFIQKLSGIASLTSQYVNAIAGTGAQVFDTRKTTPGWRDLEKYAVRCGGGQNHRRGLHDAILVKDNHLAGVGSARLGGRVFEIMNSISRLKPSPDFVEFEVDSLDQLEQLFKVVGVDIILLDNFSVEDLKRAVVLRDNLSLTDKIALEASGGVTLETIRPIAETGVERISVGALTHSAVALDISLEL